MILDAGIRNDAELKQGRVDAEDRDKAKESREAQGKSDRHAGEHEDKKQDGTT